MTIDIETLIQLIDEDGSGEIEFDEFCQLLKSAKKRVVPEEGEEEVVFDEFSAVFHDFKPKKVE